jgi:integrase
MYFRAGASGPFIEIQRRDVISLIESLIAVGKPTLANRVHALASSIFSFAVDADLMPANPCSRLRRRGVEKRGERVLSDPEIRLFWGRVIRPPISVQNGLILRLLLLTGACPGEVAGLRWDEIEHLDDPARTARVIPAERSKTGRAQYVPLSLLARATILEAQDICRDPTWVFRSPKAQGAIRPNALAIAMQRLARSLAGDAENIGSWRADPPSPHDLRRTVATRLAGLGVAAEDVSAVLGHAPASVTARHYDRYDRAHEKRRALSLWADVLAALVDGVQHNEAVVLLAGQSARSAARN